MPKGKKGFQPGNSLGTLSTSARPLAKDPICFKHFEDEYETARKIPGLPAKLRAFVSDLIAEVEAEAVSSSGM